MMKKYLKKIVTIFMLIVMVTVQFAQVGEQVVFALDKEMKFSYTSGEKKVFYNENYDYYTSYREAKLDDNIAYCVDYGRKLPSGELKYKKVLSKKAIAILAYGYPNRSVSELGVKNSEEAYLTTQLAFWSVVESTNEDVKSKLNFSYSDLKAVEGKEELFNRVKSAAKKLEAYAKANPYDPTYTMKLDSSDATIVVSETKIIAGPYKVTNTGFGSKKAKLTLSSDAPSSAQIVNKSKQVQTKFATNEEIYVMFDSTEKGSSFTLKAEYSANKYTGAIYGTSESNVQNYATVVKSPVSMYKTKKITWDTQSGNVEVLKVDQNNEKIVGVKFDLKDNSGTKIAEGVTDENGIIRFTNLTPGNYTITETYVPSGYVMGTEPISFEIKTGETYKKTIVNKKIQGRLKINKIDTDGKPIKNVVFEILDSNKNVIKKIVTDADGVASVSGLGVGIYYYREVGAPTNVIMDKAEYSFSITEPNQVVTKTVVNELVKGSLKIIKVDENKNSISGVKFQILDNNKNVVDEITTNSSGIAVSKELENGTYYYKEIKAPDTVIIDSKEYEFRVNANNTIIEKEVINELAKGSLKIIKTDSNDNTIEGVKFEILNSNKEVIKKVTTNENGVVLVENLKPGTYYYKEVVAPNNVIMDSNEYLFEIEANKITTKEVVNKLIKGKLQILKIDEEGNPIKNVKFEVLDSNKNLIETIVTDENGIAQTKELQKGIYYYKEINAPKGLIMDLTEYDFEIKEDGTLIEREVVNRYETAKLKITKLSNDTKQPLAGVKFDILDADKKVIETVITDEDGVAYSSELRVGTYYYKEIVTKGGYQLDSKEYKFKIKGNNEDVDVVVYNKKILSFLPQTGGNYSSDIGLILMVSGISILGYTFLKTRNKSSKYKQLN